LNRVTSARIVLLVVLLALVELLCRAAIIPSQVLPAPSQMVLDLRDLIVSGHFDTAILITLGNVLAAALIACGLGILLGAVVHATPRLRAVLNPIFGSFYAVPTFLFYPLMIVFFGIGRASIIGIAVLMSVVIMILATLDGLDNVPRALYRTAAIYRLSPWRRAFYITLPAALPYLFTGFKLTVAYSFIGVLASEFIMSGSGLGYEISNAYNMFENRTMYGLMLFVILVVTFVNGILHVWDDRLQRRRR
jgi:NitT/TauT family transport system permease protein